MKERVVTKGALALVSVTLVVGAALAATRPPPLRVDPGTVSDVPTAVSRVRPAVVGIRASIPPDRPSAATLGVERRGSGVIIEPDGLIVTVGYLVLEAARLDVILADGATVPARVVGHDFESGLALIRAEAPSPLPTARLSASGLVAVGQPVSIVGMDGDGHATGVAARVTALRPFVAYWEYLLERALVVAPFHPAFGGAALVDPDGALVGIVSLRLAEGHLAIPIELLLPVKPALVMSGRPARLARPWLGVRTVAIAGGVGVAGVSPVGPAQAAGLRPGDVIVRVNGARVADVEDFYRKLWSTPVGGEVVVVVYRDGGFESVTVRSQDRYTIFQFRSP